MKVSDNDFLLTDLYNANKESEQLDTLSTLCYLLDDISDLHYRFIATFPHFKKDEKLKKKLNFKAVALKFLTVLSLNSNDFC